MLQTGKVLKQRPQYVLVDKISRYKNKLDINILRVYLTAQIRYAYDINRYIACYIK